jgi:hypothetical protein
MFRTQLSGGLAWHLHAWRSKDLWSPTVQLFSDWLKVQSIHERHDSLVLIGASAGWMMPSDWLCQFKEIRTFDIDPLAATLFKFNHGKLLKEKGIHLICFTQDALVALPQIIEQNPHSFIFFDNVLGQLRFVSSSMQEAENRLCHLKKTLVDRNWGSLHDRMSGFIHQTLNSERLESQLHAHGLLNSDAEIQAWLTNIRAQSPWLDHLTQDVFPKGASVQNIIWDFKPNYRHWLQMGCVLR